MEADIEGELIEGDFASIKIWHQQTHANIEKPDNKNSPKKFKQQVSTLLYLETL